MVWTKYFRSKNVVNLGNLYYTRHMQYMEKAIFLTVDSVVSINIQNT